MTMTGLAAAGGAMAGIGGAVHGVGEVLQGSGPPETVFFESWTTGRIASNLGGEPAMSVVPDVLLSGLLTLAASAAAIWWAATATDHRHGGRVLASLSLLMLLVGGGFGPPVLGVLAAVVAGTANRSSHRTPLWPRGRVGSALGALWPALFWLCLADYAFLVFGSLFAGVVLDVDVSSAFVFALLLTPALMPVAALAGVAHLASLTRARPRQTSTTTDDGRPR